MPTILIEEEAYLRLESDLKAIDADLVFIVMKPDGLLYRDGEVVEVNSAEPEIAWLNIGLLRSKQMHHYVETVLATGTVKWLQTFNAGLDKPFYQTLFDHGIRISASSAQAIAIAEYIIANVLVSYQAVFERKRHQDAHRWQRTVFKELWHTNWVLVGFGNIGQAVAHRLRGFECNIVAVRRSGQEHPLADEVVTPDQMATHLPVADGVILACPLTDETRGMVNDAFFQQLKPGATLVNVARGQVVEQAAMINALDKGIVSQAILDVFDPEPLPTDSPLWDMENVIITPHSSNAGINTPLRGDLLFLENLRRYLANDDLLNEAFAI